MNNDPTTSLSSLLSSTEIWVRGGTLSVLVILFQILIAHNNLVEKETKRRFQHALTGHVIVQISYLLPKHVGIVCLLCAAIFIYTLRTYYPESFFTAVGPLLRPCEISGEQRLPGALYFVCGTLLTLVFIDDMTIVRYAIECLSIADPIASWIGSTIVSPKLNKGTTLAGCIGCFLSSWVVGYMMLDESILLKSSIDGSNPTTNNDNNSLLFAITIGAMACTIAEGLPFGNDNLNIPLLTAFAVNKLGR